jgi:hypothetical protein
VRPSGLLRSSLLQRRVTEVVDALVDRCTKIVLAIIARLACCGATSSAD